MEGLVIDDRLRLGRGICDIRTNAGWTQTQLAGALDLSFQQIQKYEHGISRISVFSLLRILGVLGVPPAAFFEFLDCPVGLPVPAPILDPGLEQLKRDYEHIGDPDARQVIRDLARVLAGDLPLKRSL